MMYQPVPIGAKSGLLMGLVSLAGLFMFAWPLFLPAAPSAVQHAQDAPFVFIVTLPLLILLVLAQLADGGMDAKALAMLGVLSAVNAALRPLSAGVSGIESVFLLLILAGRVFGPGFGFVLGCTSLFGSALLTAGVGPWLPFQMLAAAWVGLLAGLLPRRLGRHQIKGAGEIGLLAVYGVIAAYVFGALMNLWFWPYIAGSTMGGDSGLAYVPGAPIGVNLTHFALFSLVSSTAVWDTGRAATNVVLLVALGPGVLAILRRALVRAHFTNQQDVFVPVAGVGRRQLMAAEPTAHATWPASARARASFRSIASPSLPPRPRTSGGALG